MKRRLAIPCFAVALMLSAQITPPAPDAAEGPGHPGALHDDAANDSMRKEQAAQLAGKRNSLRQQEIVHDTARLLQLSQELKAEVDSSTKDELSLSVVKKAEEIEKLAKAVKLRMRDGY